MQLFLIFCANILLLTTHIINGYNLPKVNLGSSNFLDGGPLRPRPGFYWQEYAQYYHTDTFFDSHGKNIAPCLSPDFNVFGLVTQAIYQFKPGMTSRFQVGLTGSLPILLYSHITHNPLNITSSGSGFGDLALGIYLQFKAIMSKGRPVFVHRLEFDAFFPTGKYVPTKSFNPGSNEFYIDPYWAFTYYITPTLATSWRIHYLYSGENNKTKIKPGQAVHFNYTLEHEILPKVWIGINGYYLRQTTNDRLKEIEIPCSKEQIFSTGFGTLYTATPDDNFFFNIYFECLAKNRSQGISLFLRYFKHF